MDSTHNNKYNRKFQEIRDENTAYWIGFLAADGSIHKTKKLLTVGLASRDKNHIEKFKTFIESDAPIKDRNVVCTTNGKSYPSSFFQIYDQYIVADLEQYGIVPDKSHKDINFLQYIPEKYKIYFILGYFDGDGHFTVTNKSRSFGWCGSESNTEAITEYVKTLLNLTTSAKSRKDKGSVITYEFVDSKRDDIRLFCNFYLNQKYTIDLLDRKVDKAETMLSLIEIDDELNKNSEYNRKSAKPNTDSKRNKRLSEMNKKVCPICGRVFYPKIGDVGNYCSQECNHISQRKVIRADRVTLKNLIRTKPFLQIGKMFDVSDNTIRKWCIAEKLPFRVKDINSISDEEWALI